MSKIKNLAMVVVATCLVSLANNAMAQSPQPPGDEAQVAGILALEIVQVIGADCPQQCRLAVFPFGDSRGRISAELSASVEIIQGELIQQLTKLAAGKMHVLDRDGLAREFRRVGIDASTISAENAEATGHVLQKIGVDVAIVGSMNPCPNPPGPAELQVFAIKQSGTVTQLGLQPNPLEVVTNYVPPAPANSQFNVEIVVDGHALPLQSSTSSEAGVSNANFLVLARRMVGKEYSLRLTNRGVPQPSAGNTDRQPLFGAVVTVDGVNSVYQQDGRGQLGPVVLHPKNCQKWLISGPGQSLVPDPNSPLGYRIESVTGNGNSVVMIQGFQNGSQVAKAFTFSMVRDSVAENVGITNDIGLITVHFYPEDRSSDQPPQPVVEKSLGATRPGREFSNLVYKVRTRLQANPIEVWRVFYKYEDDPAVNQLGLQPLAD